MTDATLQPVRSRFSLWLQAVRPFSFSASITPVLVAGMIALNDHPLNTYWFLFPLTLICAVLFHMSSNLVSEYYDLVKGVDRKDTFGSSRILVDDLLEPREVLRGGLLLLAIGFILGLVLVYFRGWEILLLGVIGLCGAYFYTAAPVGFKYFALGDLGVFTMFGPLMVIGAYFALTGVYNVNAIYISLPIGFLVITILHANNTRDIMYDSQAGIKTFAMVIGVAAAKYYYYALQIGAFITVAVLVVLQILEPWTLIVFISLPVSIKNMKEMSTARKEDPSLIAMLDVKTAQHHLQFGLLLAIGLLVSSLV